MHTTTHSVDVAAPAAVVYAVLADATAWPQHFPPTVHVERPEAGEGWERLHLWATANGSVRSWTSRRELDATNLLITFRQEVSPAPVAAMAGTWTVVPTGPRDCHLELGHTFSAVDDDPEGLDWIRRAVERNSTAELARVRETAERAGRMDELLFSFEDEIHVEAPVDEVYDFLADAAAWPERLPHVARLDLVEDEPGVQVMTMVTHTPDHSPHTTESVRLCRPAVAGGPARILYKQTRTPALMTAHTGEWLLEPDRGGTRAVSRHTVTVNEDAVRDVLSRDATVAEARRFLRAALGRNSRTTLALAKQFAEERRDQAA